MGGLPFNGWGLNSIIKSTSNIIKQKEQTYSIS